jgi:hypothetical protein
MVNAKQELRLGRTSHRNDKFMKVRSNKFIVEKQREIVGSDSK